jgi:hypothetical protein
MLQIEDEVTVADIDEAIAHIAAALKVDEFGNRMDWRKKQLLQASIDDLLDARLALQGEGAHGNRNSNSGNAEGVSR